MWSEERVKENRMIIYEITADQLTMVRPWNQCFCCYIQQGTQLSYFYLGD